MKKIVAIILAVLMLTISCSALAENMIVHITALCYDTNHLGNNWEGIYSIGGMEVYDGMVLDMGIDTYEFITQITEHDSSPEYGIADTTFNVTANRLTRGFTVEQYLTVTENKGIFKDYWCEWYVYYEFTPVGTAIVLH